MIRFPKVEVYVHGFKEWALHPKSDGHESRPFSNPFVDVLDDLLSVSVSNSLSGHTASATIKLLDREAIPTIDSGGADKGNYPDPVKVQQSYARTKFFPGNSYYLTQLFPQNLVMVKFLGTVYSGAGDVPGGISQDLWEHQSNDMDFVGLIDSVQRVKGIAADGQPQREINITCRGVSKLLVDDSVVYYPYQGLIPDAGDADKVMATAPVIMGNANLAPADITKARNVLTLRRCFGRSLIGKWPEIDDSDPASTAAEELMNAEHGAFEVRKLIAAVFRILHSTNIEFNYQIKGTYTNVKVRPISKKHYSEVSAPATAPNELEPTREYEEPAKLVATGMDFDQNSGLLSVQVDDNAVLDIGDNNIFGDKTFCCPSSKYNGIKRIGDYERIYTDFVSGRGPVMGFIENIINRPFAEMFVETYGRRNLIVVRTPPFDFEDIYATWQQQQSFKRITDALYLSDTLARDDRDVFSFFRVEPVGLFSAEYSAFCVNWVALQELIDRYGLREMAKQANMFNWNNIGINISPMVKTGDQAPTEEQMRGLPPKVKESLTKAFADHSVTESAGFDKGFFNPVSKFRDQLVRWFAPNPLFLKGQITIRCPREPIKIGTWVTLEHSKELFYIENWKKDFQFGAPPTATLTVSRGFHRQGYPLICRRSDWAVVDDTAPGAEPYTVRQWLANVYPNIIKTLNTGVYPASDVPDLFADK